MLFSEIEYVSLNNEYFKTTMKFTLPKIELKKVFVGLIITVAGLFIVLALTLSGILEPVELSIVDFRFLVRGPLSGITAVEPIPKDSLDVVLVSIDDESWRLMPYTWPYPRDVWGRVVRNLTRAGAAVIVFDIEFDSEDSKSAVGDSIFAESIKYAKSQGVNVVLAAKYIQEKTRIPPDYINFPIKVLRDAGAETGLIGEIKDRDGVTRKALLFSMVTDDPVLHLALPLKAIKYYLDISDDTKLIPVGKGFDYGGLYISSYRRSNTFIVNFYGPPSNAGPAPPLGPWRTFNRYPVSGVVDDEDFELKESLEDNDWMELFYEDGFMASIGMLQESPFKDKIVVIGVAVETQLDLKETPFYNYFGVPQLMPGMETHAHAIQTILDGNNIEEFGFDVELTWLIILSFISFGFLMWLGPVFGGIVLFLIGVVYADVSIGMFFGDNLWIPKKILDLLLTDNFLNSLNNPQLIGIPAFGTSVLVPVVTPLLGLLITYGGNILYQFVIEQREKKKINNMFSTYVSPKVLEHLQDNPDAFGLSGKKMSATVFFSDVVGFTSISESLSAENLAVVLNRYLSPMTEILMSYDGYVDKYEGDAIMCDFGVPMPDPDHAWKACFSAIDQQENLNVLREEIKDEFDVEIYVRMGINSGDVSAGNMGSAQRFQYTVMGDAVNQASRFEGANKQYNSKIMIGDSTYQMAKDKIEVRPLDKLVVKGKAIPIDVYELLAKKGELSPEMSKMSKFFEEGINLYWNKKWDLALSKFHSALEIISDDGPSLTFIKRCELFKETPPPHDWQGEFVMTTK